MWWGSSVRALADYLAHQPSGCIVTAVPVGQGNYLVAIEDRRDGREHILETPDDLEAWLESFKQGRLLQPTKAFWDCCTHIPRGPRQGQRTNRCRHRVSRPSEADVKHALAW